MNGSNFFKKMRKSLGNKRDEVCDGQGDEITHLYGDFKEGECMCIFDNKDFGYERITKNRDTFIKLLKDCFQVAKLKIPGTLIKASLRP